MPCDTCEFGSPPVELSKENETAFELWIECITQWRTGPAGIIGIDYAVIHLEAKRLQIELSPCLMRKIKLLERSVLRKQDGSSESDNQGSEEG